MATRNCNYRGEIMWKKWTRKNREGRKGEREVVKEEDRNRERERETTEAKYWLEYIWENNSINEKIRVVGRIHAVWKTTVNLRCVLKVHLSAAQPTFKTVRSMYGLHNSGLSRSSVRYVQSKAAGGTLFPAVWWSWCSNLCSSGLAFRVNKTMLACLTRRAGNQRAMKTHHKHLNFKACKKLLTVFFCTSYAEEDMSTRNKNPWSVLWSKEPVFCVGLMLLFSYLFVFLRCFFCIHLLLQCINITDWKLEKSLCFVINIFSVFYTVSRRWTG